MNWLVENAVTLSIVLGLLAAGLVGYARLNQQVKYLVYAFIVLALLAVFWMLITLIPSDRRQLEDNVHAMKDAVVNGRPDDLMKHISKDFRYKSLTRDQLAERAQQLVRENQIRDVRITKFAVDELSRANKSAKARFRVTVWAKETGEPVGMFVVQADFVLEGEDWKLKTVRFYNPMVNQDQEVDLSFLR